MPTSQYCLVSQHYLELGTYRLLDHNSESICQTRDIFVVMLIMCQVILHVGVIMCEIIINETNYDCGKCQLGGVKTLVLSLDYVWLI